MSQAPPSAPQTRRQRREQRLAERRRQEAGRKTDGKLWLWIGAAILVLAVAGGAYYYSRSSSQPAFSGAIGDVTPPDQGRDHVQPGQPHEAYNSTPPTSGPHYPRWTSWGIKTEPVPDELQVHNLEHGGIMVQYNCQAKAAPVADCAALKKELESLVNVKPRVIVAPHPKMDHPIALTSWGHLLVMDTFDRARAVAFINTYFNHAPEDVQQAPGGM